MKTQRHAAILKIVRSETVASQEQLRELLKGEGFDVTQATLSRDIRELGLAKVAAPDGGSHYAPPPEAGAAIRPHLGQLLPAVLVSVDGVGPLLPPVAHRHSGWPSMPPAGLRSSGRLRATTPSSSLPRASALVAPCRRVSRSWLAFPIREEAA